MRREAGDFSGAARVLQQQGLHWEAVQVLLQQVEERAQHLAGTGPAAEGASAAAAGAGAGARQGLPSTTPPVGLAAWSQLTRCTLALASTRQVQEVHRRLAAAGEEVAEGEAAQEQRAQLMAHLSLMCANTGSGVDAAVAAAAFKVGGD